MRTAVVVFGREPVPGRVKTRLAAVLGDVAAAEIYRGLLEHVLAEAAATGLEVTLELASPLEGAWRPPAGVGVRQQVDGDLGRRMEASFARCFAAGAEAVVLVGSDVPLVRRSHLMRAAEGCTTADVVLGPARDGGYWLVAQKAPGVAMFSGIPWSSPQTLTQTRHLLSTLGVHYSEIEELADIDVPDDLEAAVRGAGLSPPLRALLAAHARRG